MITIEAPTGDFSAKLSLQEVNKAWVGEMVGKAGAGPMVDLKFDGENISWTTKIERPMPMKLKFQGVREGDAVAGKVKFGIFATGTFSGKRIPV